MISTDEPTSLAATVRCPTAIMPSATALPRGALSTILSWADRRRQRHALAELDDHLLRDIGLTRHQARVEMGKPFWCA
jgi:uncharacterized protein YjiS (DUF1127 family)